MERIGENCEPALCTVLFMAGAGGSLTGLTAVVRAGSAVAVLTRCSVPPHLQILQNLPAEFDLPPLDAMHVAVLRSKVSQRSSAVNAMYEQMVRTLGG